MVSKAADGARYGNDVCEDGGSSPPYSCPPNPDHEVLIEVKTGSGCHHAQGLEGAGVLNRRHVKELLPVPGMYDTGRGPCLLGEHAPRPAPGH